VNSSVEQLTNRGPFPAGLFITDLDGTLFRSDRTAAERDLETLVILGKKGVVRAVATGRSLFSFKRAVGDTLPVDYVIFSTGAGIIHYPSGRLLRKKNLPPVAVKRSLKALIDAGLDFMVHRPIPDNHRFAYWGNTKSHPDFIRRIQLYEKFCHALDGADGIGHAAQLLVIVHQSNAQPMIDHLRDILPQLNVIRTTSPLDGESTWIEIFHKDVSKSRAVKWLASRLGVSRERTLSVGNDYNDTDMLQWAGSSFVVDNAPEDLKKRFPSVASNDQCGVSEAVSRWLNERI